MADDDTIIQDIELRGADQVAQELGKLATSSEVTFGKMAASAKVASTSLEGIGASSQKAAVAVETSATASAASVATIAAGATRAGASFESLAQRVRSQGQTVRTFGTQAAAAIQAPVAATSRFRGVLDLFGATAKEAGRDVNGMSRSAADAASGMSRLNDSSDMATGGVGKLETFAIRTGSSLRLLGRAAQIRELSQLGRAIAVLGRAFALGAPLLFVAALEKLASSASQSADQISDLAARSKLTTDQFQNVSSAFVAVGSTAEAAGQATKGLADVLKQTDENTRHNADSFRELDFAVQQARKGAQDLARDYEHSLVLLQRSFRDFNQQVRDVMVSNSESSLQFSRSLRDINQELSDLDRGPLTAQEQKERRRAQLIEQRGDLEHKRAEELTKQAREQIHLIEQRSDLERRAVEEARKGFDSQVLAEKAIRDTERAARDARAEAERNATVLEKLGVTALDATGKLKKAPAALEDIAQKLSNVTDPAKLLAIEADLIAAGIDRNMLPALRRGAQGYKDLVAEGEKIRPPFTTAQLKIADDLNIRIGQTTQAFGGLKDQIGLAVAPTFIPFFEKIRDTIIRVTPSVVQFFKEVAEGSQKITPALQVVGDILKSVFTTIGDVFTQVLIPAFEGLKKGADDLAKSFNQDFGTSVTGTQILTFAIGALGLALFGIPGLIAAVVVAAGLLLQKFDENRFLIAAITVGLIVLALAFGSLPIVIATLALAIGFVIAKWDDLKAIGSITIQFIKQQWNGMVKFLSEKIDGFFKFFKDGWDGAVKIAQGLLDSFVTAFENSWVGRMVTGIKAVIGWFGKLLEAEAEAADNAPVNPLNPVNAARGGHIRGPGTSTSDSIWARLSDGEFVMKTRAVNHWGLPFMDAINRMGRLPGFNVGGLVQTMAQPMLVPRFAGGGHVDSSSGGAGGRPVILNIGGESFNLLTQDQDTAERFGRYVSTRRLTSAGRKPSYWGAD